MGRQTRRSMMPGSAGARSELAEFAREWRPQYFRLGAAAQAHPLGLTAIDQPPGASRIARQIRSGVAGISICAIPSGARASRIALIIVCGAAMQPAWPAPL